MEQKVEWIRNDDGKLKTFPSPWDSESVIMQAIVGESVVQIYCGVEAVPRTEEKLIMEGLDNLARQAYVKLLQSR